MKELLVELIPAFKNIAKELALTIYVLKCGDIHQASFELFHFMLRDLLKKDHESKIATLNVLVPARQSAK
ncbi:hypothetical protein M514_10978 [Trichuris suis]|uniref:Uncharacterized protein n=1 Tax=Trichuris suis TaxID=68888 RepID=A0A085LT44_9BILA|nr:hypothetical protein M513_10978 [Trichuris suis]KFD61740.1 hypothetical protein M514_10978 [Trichuris suis]